jgi:hypothetical protein
MSLVILPFSAEVLTDTNNTAIEILFFQAAENVGCTATKQLCPGTGQRVTGPSRKSIAALRFSEETEVKRAAGTTIADSGPP